MPRRRPWHPLRTLRHAHPHPRLAQAAAQHERRPEEDAPQRRASAFAAGAGDAHRASHLEVGGAGEDDAISSMLLPAASSCRRAGRDRGERTRLDRVAERCARVERPQAMGCRR